jgi:serine/threonine protein kinase/tetratricopeptide (TPR) repeat protein
MGAFELDLQSGELRPPEGERILLREQPFQVLRMLVEREGKIVPRAEIRKKLWPNDTIVDFDHSINVAIAALRRTLGDSTANPRYIETIARRGYRLVPPIEWLETNVPAADATATAPERPPLGDLTGRKVCHYRVLEVLGGGGMGMVYKAEDLKLGRRAALKFLPEELAGDPIALQRLEQEAQTASSLNHPNICTIYGIEEHEGQRFIAMELLEGQTLQERLAASAPEPIPVSLLVDVAIQLCRGLEAAHGKAIVHRDIKPANIFLIEQGTAKLLDFGIAKLVAVDDAGEPGEAGEARTAPRPTTLGGLTRIGVAAGTFGYMSPEQVRKEDLDGRSDLFSLGLVLYEMATGRRAFGGNTSVAVHDAILTTTPPPPETLNREVPPAVSAVIGRALQKDCARRYQTATEMRLDLERARTTSQPRGTRRLRRWSIAGLAASLAVLAAAIQMQPRHGLALGPSDTIVLAHLTNSTGERVFDEALYTALRIALEQTPYLNVLADHKLSGTLASLDLDPDTRITPEVALEVCVQTGSKVVVAPSIADAGNRLRLELRVIDSKSRSNVLQVADEAVGRDDVVSTLGDLAVELREDLGEPLSSIAKYNVPLPDATSRSPEALELLTQGYRMQLNGTSLEAIPYFQRAVQADSNLALAHAALSAAYMNRGEALLAAASGRSAFALRDRLTAPVRFSVESDYYGQVLGDWEETCDVRARWVEAFPHDVVGRNNLAYCLSILGELDRALGESREVARLLPAPFTYRTWILRLLLADHEDEAQATIEDALRRGFDDADLRDLQVQLAYLRNDSEAMRQQWTWAEGAGADGVIMGEAMVEASQGRFRDALHSVDSASDVAEPLDAAIYAIEAALMQAEVGLVPNMTFTDAPVGNLHARLLGALALARMGHLERAQLAADALRRDFPSNTIVQKYGLPLIDGAVMLRTGDAGGALELMRASSSFDLAYTRIIPPLYPAYIRGLAYLQAGDAPAAAAEFQKVMSRPGLVGRGIIGPLAWLQLARAQCAMGEVAKSIATYEAFLGRWSDADADLPLYVAAKSEYEKLRRGTRS